MLRHPRRNRRTRRAITLERTLLLAVAAALAAAPGCAGPTPGSGPPGEPEPDSPSAAADAEQEDPFAGADRALSDFERWCEAGAALWEVELCGPVVLVDPGTREAMANAPPPDSSLERTASTRWRGELPDAVPVANTAVEWDGQRWTMLMVPLPRDAYDRTALLAHEAFHRIQPVLDLEAETPIAPHLQERTGRLWLRLEIRALAEALRSTGEEGLRAGRDAALFRRMRYSEHPGADTLEAKLEIHEGLAAYTGSRIARDAVEVDDARVAEEIAAYDDRPSYGRSFAYATGPGLGVLLDRWAGGWREEVGREEPLHVLFEKAVSPVIGDARARASAYGWSEVAAEEERRERAMLARLDTLRRHFIERPLVRIALKGAELAFDPRSVVSLDDRGTVYVTARVRGTWGSLDVEDPGVLVDPGWTLLTLAGPPRRTGEESWEGPGWTLELAEGYALEAVEDGLWRAGPANR